MSESKSFLFMLEEDKADASFNYGYAMLGFAKIYHEMKLMEAKGLNLLCDQIYTYSAELKLHYRAKVKNETSPTPSNWELDYRSLRAAGFRRTSPAVIEKSSMTIRLLKLPVSVIMEISFPECKVEITSHTEELIKKPVYSIDCGPQTELKDPAPEDIEEEPIIPVPEPETQTLHPQVTAYNTSFDDTIPF